jgi:phospholipase/carboxylesterase
MKPVHRTAIAGLKVEIAGEDLPRSAPTVVMLHGFDSSAGEMSPFAASYGLAARCVFPEGPLTPVGTTRDGHAWWQIDEHARRHAIETRTPRDLSRSRQDGVDLAREALAKLLDEVTFPRDQGHMVLGGFSQGAMLACDYALRSSRPLSGLVLFSGARILHHEWVDLYARKRGLPVLMTHGRSDPDLAFEAAERLRDDLMEAGLDVTWLPFEGGHEIPPIAIRGLQRFLARITGTPVASRV